VSHHRKSHKPDIQSASITPRVIGSMMLSGAANMTPVPLEIHCLSWNYQEGNVSNVTGNVSGNVAGNVTGNVTGYVGGVTANVTANSTAIANAVWDMDATNHQTLGTFGQAIGDPGNTKSIWASVVTDAEGVSVGTDTANLIQGLFAKWHNIGAANATEVFAQEYSKNHFTFPASAVVGVQ